MPSVRSREIGFYYGHPRNRFWRVIGSIIGEEFPHDVDGKREILLRHGIALWDVVAECDIAGSSDSSIKNVVPNDISVILNVSPIQAVFTNGSTADRIYRKYQLPITEIEATHLPSTSPANASCSFDALVRAWSADLKYFLL